MLDNISGETIATEVKMSRAGNDKVIIILESSNDISVFRNFFNENNIEYIASYGKENAVKAISILNEEKEIDNYLSIVDSDFDIIDNISYASNLFHTDYHDIEISIACSESFMKICKEYCTENKTSRINLEIEDITTYIFNKIKYLSILRYCNHKDYNIFCFSRMDIRKFINKDNLDIDVDKMICHIINKTIGNIDDPNNNLIKDSEEIIELKEKIPPKGSLLYDLSKHKNLTYDLKQLTNGHDFVSVFSIGLRKCFATLNPKVACPENMIKIFRIGYSFDDFKKSNLFIDLNDWSNCKGLSLYK